MGRCRQSPNNCPITRGPDPIRGQSASRTMAGRRAWPPWCERPNSPTCPTRRPRQAPTWYPWSTRGSGCSVRTTTNAGPLRSPEPTCARRCPSASCWLWGRCPMPSAWRCGMPGATPVCKRCCTSGCTATATCRRASWRHRIPIRAGVHRMPQAAQWTSRSRGPGIRWRWARVSTAFVPQASSAALEPDGPLLERDLRRLLGSAMSGAGFVAHPQEWWHWEYGTRYWAAVTGEPVRYGHARPSGY